MLKFFREIFVLFTLTHIVANLVIYLFSYVDLFICVSFNPKLGLIHCIVIMYVYFRGNINSFRYLLAVSSHMHVIYYMNVFIIFIACTFVFYSCSEGLGKIWEVVFKLYSYLVVSCYFKMIQYNI